MRDVTDAQLRSAMKCAKGNVSEAARILGKPRSTVQDWVNPPKPRASSRIAKEPKQKPIPLMDSYPESGLVINRQKKRRYVITCAQNNTALHEGFVSALFQYCQHNDAQLIVIPIRYKNPTAYLNDRDYSAWWPAKLHKYYLNEDILLNDNLMVMGNMKIQATAAKPLNGIGPVAGRHSAIIGHGKIALKCIPTPHNKTPRILTTTGACTVKNYSSTKDGRRAEFHHTFGATVVEIDGDKFWLRQINATDDGSFYELDTFYHPTKKPTTGHGLAGLVCGDIHNDFIDPGVLDATWKAGDSIVKLLRPQHIFLHDTLDFYSGSRHHEGNLFTQFAKFRSGMGDIQAELDRLVQSHNNIFAASGATLHYISSNHNDGLKKWLNAVDIRKDPANALFYHYIMYMMYSRTEMTPNGASSPDPVALYMRDKIINPDSTFFHTPNELVDCMGVDCGQHGHMGPNGSRGSLSSFARSGYKTATCHTHHPGIEDGAYQGGTSSLLSLEYNLGYSSWMQAHIGIYPNGKRTLLFIIDGEWKLRDKRRKVA